MDIVSRLKTFINHLGIPVTQFADVCNIPRPTLSQLLNGRNKKVSDELIRKLHTQYPELSIPWLLFGEGDMLSDGDIKTSEPQKQALIDFGDVHHPKSQGVESSIDFEKDYNDSASENSTAETQEASRETVITHLPITPTALEVGTDSSRKIVNIIVYYSDNSFESFIPGSPAVS